MKTEKVVIPHYLFQESQVNEIIIAAVIFASFSLNIVLIFVIRRYQGQIVVTQDENGKRLYSLEIGEDPDKLDQMRSIRFKIVNNKDIAS